MRGLRVLLLGRPRLELDGQPLTATLPLKHQALVYYLAAAQGPVPRAEIAALLWEELDEAAARGNLRTALMRLRRALPGMLAAEGSQLGFVPEAPVHVDLQALALAAAGHGTYVERVAAAAAWRGPLLEGFDPGADAFERWLLTQRARAQREAVTLRRALAGECEADGRADDAVAHWRALLDIDEADEEAHMSLMRMLGAAGRRTAAIAQYEACRAALAERLGAKPSAACYALYTRIHAERPEPTSPVVAAAPHVAVTEPAITGPAATTEPAAKPLLGRAAELAVLAERLRDSECRWLTVVGPGGVGKTSLARVAAEGARARFRNGALWLSGRDRGGPLRDPETLAQQVLQRVGSDRQAPGALLLVLDNLDTVQEVPAIARLLQSRAPGVAVLATSRRRLGAPREWLLELAGLSLARIDGKPASSPAALLLVQAVSRLLPGYTAAQEADAVEALCARVGGLPLALELCARGVQHTGVAAVLRRLEAGEAPADDTHDAEQRHHSITAVLEDAWEALPAHAQSAARRLAVLPAAFDLPLAEALGVAAGEVGALREHSWLSRTQGGLLAFHPLQLDHLRRRPDVIAIEDEVRELLARHAMQRLPPAPAFGMPYLPPRDAASLVREAVFGAAQLEMTLQTLLRGDADRLASFVDRAVVLLRAADRGEEAAALLARAAQHRDSDAWRVAGCILLEAEVRNTLGDATRALHLFDAGLARLGLDDAARHPGTWAGLPAALARAWLRRGWPPPGPHRRGFECLLVSSLTAHTQLQSFSLSPDRAARLNLILEVVGRRTSEPSDRLPARVLRTYGMVVMGRPRMARALLRGHQGREALADPELELSMQEGNWVIRLALGDWAGLDEGLLAVAEALESRGSYRRAMECRSLAAKLRFYQGRLHAAMALFADCTERSLHRPGGAWRPWGPFGEAEVALCLGTLSQDELERLAATGARWLSEMENMDNAYTFRRLGLVARLAWVAGDTARAREAVLAGAAAATRIRRVGFWAQEGWAGLGDTLLALRRHERTVGGALPPLDVAWRALANALARHERVFPPGQSLRLRLEGERRLDDGDATGAAWLQRAVAHAEGQGMRIELVRACEVLARHLPSGTWSSRASGLWDDMGVARVFAP